MAPRKTLFILLLIGILLFVGGVTYFRSAVPVGTAENCVVMRTGNVRVEVRFSSAFTDVSYPNALRIMKSDRNGLGEVPYVLSINADSFEPLTDIIGRSPGPLFSTSTFNGYTAGFATQFDKSVGYSKIYRFPVGDETLLVIYSNDQLPSELKPLADKMLREIIITTTQDNVTPAIVEKCD